MSFTHSTNQGNKISFEKYMYSFWKKKSILIYMLDLYLLSLCFFFNDIALVINFHLYDLPNDPLRSHTLINSMNGKIKQRDGVSSIF